ncbi:hypothetical protein IT409_02055 [Candidatus Falkowbacteria bacterium]|nr:hypothetical protein [Candidatus Falkowbacteria bacterium]
MNYSESNQVCEPVEIVDKKGIHKVLYLCKKPFVQRIAAYKHNKIHLWTDIALGATVVILSATLISLLAFNIFKQKNQIRITLAPKHVVLGEVATFDVTYENTSKKKPTHDTNITLRSPQTFHNPVIASSALEEVALTIPLGTLDPQESGSFEVRGELLSNINTDISLLFVTDYVNELNEPQQESTLTQFHINESIVGLKATLPSSVIIGSEISFALDFTNLPQPLSDYNLSFAHAQGFTLDESSQTLQSLSDEKRSLMITGTIGGSPSNAPLVITLTRNVHDQSIIYAQISQPITTYYSKIKVDSITDSAYISPGQQITARINISNNESATFTNAQLQATIEGEFTDINFLEKTYKASRNVITLPVLDIEAGQTHTQDLDIAALSNFIPKNENLGPQDIKVKVKVVGTIHGNEITLSTASPLVIPISSAPQLISQGIFYTNTGDQIGIGSLPPSVDEYTAYWGLVRIKNGVNPLSNVVVTAHLAPHTQYDDVYNVTDGSPVRVLPDGNTIEWYVGDIASYAGVVTQAPEMRLQIGITPTIDQRGKSVPLLTNITLSGTDTRTGAKIQANAQAITTSIFKDVLMNVVR